MTASQLLIASLCTLLLPAPVGLAVPLVARAGDASLAACLGLACLAASVALTDMRRTQPSELPGANHAQGAVRLRGRWRQLPRDVSAIVTAGGLLTVDRAQGVAAPSPGSPVTALARDRGPKPPLIISMESLGPVSGAWVDRWRLACQGRIRSLVTGPAKGLLAALLLGDRSDLERPVQRQCRKTGTVHLLALSGLHVGVVAVILARVLGWAGWPGAPLTGALLLAFVTLAGSRPPLLRAAQGWALITWGRHSGRQSSPLHRLGVAACALLIMDSAVADDLGAQLSFVAVAGLLSAMPLARGAAQALVAPAGAVLATAPLAAAAFGQVQPWGILLTPLLMPFVGGILTVGVCCVLTGPLTSALDPLSGPLLQWLCNGFLATEAQLAAWVPEPLQPPHLPLPPLLVSLAIVAALNGLSGEVNPEPRQQSHGDSAP